MKIFKNYLAVLVCLLAFPAYGQQVTRFCNNLVSYSDLPAAHYVGDTITLAVDRYSVFTLVIGGVNTPKGEGYSASHTALVPGSTTLAASTYPGTTWGNCTLTSNVFAALSAQISSITGSLFAASPINFSSSYTGGAGGNTYLWTFGDGITSADKHPIHTYHAAGTYALSLVVTDQYARAATATQNITISDDPNVPGAPTNLRTELISCGTTAGYIFDWRASGAQPSNAFEFQFKSYYSSNWGSVYSGSQPYEVLRNMSQNHSYNWRVRGCISAGSGCGPYATQSLRTAACGGIIMY